MKLIFCPNCQDIVKLRKTKTFCECGTSWGYYKPNGIDAVINYWAIPLGFTNSSFSKALEKRPYRGLGTKFTSFVIPKVCPTIFVEEN